MPTYIVTDYANRKRIVEADTPAGARRHVARDLTVGKISVRECFDLSAQGLTLETAGEARDDDNQTNEEE